MNTEKKYDVIVVGAGISGLTAAYKAKKEGKSVLVLEKSISNGGVIQTLNSEVGHFELGPNSFAINPSILSLIQELGLEKELVYANSAAQKRYIFLNGKPTLINPKKLLFSSEILNFKGKIKLLSERFKKSQTVDNETLAAAVRRRFNDDVLQTLVNPIISGIYAGDAEALEYKSSMKKLYQFEQEFGSFTKGFLKSKKNGATRKIVTFKKGLQQLITALTALLKNELISSEVIKIQPSQHEVAVSTSSHTYTGTQVILSSPAYSAGELIKSLDNDLGTKLTNIQYPTLLSAQLAFDKKDVHSHLDAFGLLIPKQAGKVTLGIINYSSVFELESNHHKYNLFIDVKEAATESYIINLLQQATSELKEIYKIEGAPIFKNHKVWSKAIPQFNVGHADLMEAVDQFEIAHPQISFIGNWRTGVAVGDCIHY